MSFAGAQFEEKWPAGPDFGFSLPPLYFCADIRVAYGAWARNVRMDPFADQGVRPSLIAFATMPLRVLTWSFS